MTQKTQNTPAMTSSELLKRMRQRNQQTTIVIDDDVTESNSQNAEQASASVEPSVDAADLDLLQDVRSFVAFRASVDGEARTDELVSHFGARLPPHDSAKFKAMLQQLCDFVRRDGIGVWRLKQEFR